MKEIGLDNAKPMSTPGVEWTLAEVEELEEETYVRTG